MKKDQFLKILSSLPVILLALYFTKILGICLIVLRCVAYKDKKLLSTSKQIILIGVLFILPKLLELFKVFNLDFSILNSILDSKIYISIVSFGKTLLIIGVILLIIAYALTYVLNSFQNSSSALSKSVMVRINEFEKKELDRRQENDMKIKMQNEKAKNTGVIICKNCGASNLVVGKTGKCRYCRSLIEKK